MNVLDVGGEVEIKEHSQIGMGLSNWNMVGDSEMGWRPEGLVGSGHLWGGAICGFIVAT